MRKNWWKSKTIWVNLLTMLIWIFTALSGIVASPWLIAFFGSSLGVVNILLRFVTASPISDLLLTSAETDKFNGVPVNNRSYSITEIHHYND